jgi:hypothetical protein
MQKQLFLDDLLRRLKTIKKNYTDKIRCLPESDLIVKPSESSWSVIECIEHLNMTGDLYLPQFYTAVRNPKNQSSSQSFRRGFIGRYSANSLRPDGKKIKNKVKTFKRFTPANQTRDTPSLLNTFESQIDDLMKIIDLSQNIDIGKARITTAFGSILKFKMGDALDFVIAHIERHIVQAERVIDGMPQ